MKAFRFLTLIGFVLASCGWAQESGAVTFERVAAEPISLREIASVLGFVAVVGGAVFLLIRRRGDEAPRMSLDE